MTMAYLSGLFSASQINLKALAGFIALGLLINSKQALTIWLRSSEKKRIEPGTIFVLHIFLATALLFPLYQQYDLRLLLPYAVFPAAYLTSLKLFGEHAIFTEALGFILLSLSALIARAAVGSGIDAELFVAAAVFFTTGVFRVRIQFKKELLYRVIMLVYVITAVLVYKTVKVNALLLIPLLDNVIFSVTLYRVSLQGTGWIEMVKGAVFVLLIASFGYL